MTLRDELKSASERYYAEIAKVIGDNPTKSYATLMAERGYTAWAIRRAVRLASIDRPRGAKSPAYRKK